MDILLVFGRITAKQYDLARLQMHKRGLKPLVVHIDPEEKYRDELTFTLETDERLRVEGAYAGLSRKQQAALRDQQAEELLNEFVKKALGNKRLSDVKAILLPPCNDPYYENWQWLIDRIKHKILEYTVHSGESGEDYVVGP